MFGTALSFLSHSGAARNVLMSSVECVTGIEAEMVQNKVSRKL